MEINVSGFRVQLRNRTKAQSLNEYFSLTNVSNYTLDTIF